MGASAAALDEGPVGGGIRGGRDEEQRGTLPGDGLTLRSPIFQHALHDRKGPEALASGASEPVALDGGTAERQGGTARRGGGGTRGGGGRARARGEGPGAGPREDRRGVLPAEAERGAEADAGRQRPCLARHEIEVAGRAGRLQVAGRSEEHPA